MYKYDFNSWLQYRSDTRFCRELLKKGSQSFYAASLLLPRIYRQPIMALYAFCRVADDEIDRTNNPSQALERLHNRLNQIYSHTGLDNFIDRSFSDVVHQYGIPKALPEALLEGFHWDVENRRYASLSDVYAYSARVAGTVGTMMALIMGARKPEVLSRACDLGVAMQLTNIARDVGEDARMGRVYLPLDLMEQRGLNVESWLREPQFNDAIGAIVQVLLDKADVLYDRSEWGISKLPLGCRPAIFAARLIYAEIGRVLEQRDLDSVNQRSVVSHQRKVGLLINALGKAAKSRKPDLTPALTEVRFLIDAVAQT